MTRLALTVAFAVSLLTVAGCDHEHGEDTHTHDDAQQAETTAPDVGGDAQDAAGEHDHGDGSHSHDEPATEAIYGEDAAHDDEMPHDHDH